MASNLIKEAEHPGIRASREKRLHDERNHRHRHNGMYGASVSMLSTVRGMQHSASATPEAKNLAHQIEGLMIQLADDLYTYRIELDGKKVTPEHH